MNGGAVQQRSVYLENTYTTEVVSPVVTEGWHDQRRWLAVRDNIAHPQGGGQPADTATINGVPASVMRVHSDTPLIALLPDSDTDTVQLGDEVAVSVDRATRLENATLHTAGHLVDAAVRRRHYTHIVSNHFPGQARIEFEAAAALDDAEQFVIDVQTDVDTVIAQELAVETYWEHGKRYVRIGEFSLDECAGTHVSHLGEICDLVVRAAKVKKGRLKVGYAARHCEGSDH